MCFMQVRTAGLKSYGVKLNHRDYVSRWTHSDNSQPWKVVGCSSCEAG